jgi:pyruvate/2-oxoglutarate dehydrogenase complex dihydrolipoamide dehydrogenase (E3) component
VALAQRVDYDLVIIGNGIAALRAAISAIKKKLRVGLIFEQSDRPLLATWEWQQQSLFQQLQRPSVATCLSHPQQVSELLTYSQQLAALRTEQYSPAALASQGIDVVSCPEVGQFCHHRHQLSLVIGNRQLTARIYLLAGLRPPVDALRQQLLAEKLAATSPWLIRGDHPQACELAYLFQRLTGQVHLAPPTGQLLPSEDPGLRNQVIAQLEAAGIQMPSPNSAPNAWGQDIQVIDDPAPKLDPSCWNLTGVGVEVTPSGIPVNAYLQTSHPQIYACGSLLAGYDRPEFAQAETSWVVQNQLGTPRPLDYRLIPWTIQLNPPLTRIGWTEQQAIRMGAQVQVYHYRLQPTVFGAWDDLASGFCQLLTTVQGQLLGAMIVGQQSPSVGQCLALALKQQPNLRLRDLMLMLGL